MGKLQTHLITTFFHALPRGQPPASLPSNTGAESSAASSSSNPVKLAHQHNWATQAVTRTQSTSAADHTTTSPAGQQCVGTPSTSRTAADAPPPEAGPDVQEETISHRRHGRHDLRDERELYRSPGHRPLGRGGASPPLHHRSSMRMQERPLPKMDSWKTLHAPTPASANGQPEHQPCTSTAINMAATASAPSHLLDPMDEEIAALQKRNQLIKLQQRRSQLMANANLEQVPMRANPGSNKYPVM